MRASLRPLSLIPSLAVLLALAACGGRPGADGTTRAKAATDSTKTDPAVPVEITRLGTGSIETVIRATSTLEAESRVTVAAEATRRVVQLLVEEGDRVQSGQTLLRLQDDEQRSALAKAQTQFDQAQREWQRQEKLFEQKLTTEKVHNDALAAFEQRKLELDDARRELGYTQVKTPIRGTVTRRFVKVGDQVTLGAQLFEIVDFGSLQALVFVPEKDLGQLAVGQRARVTASAARGEPFAGRVLRVAPIVDARSGTVKVTVDVGGQAGLLPGMYVDVELVTAVRTDALLLPKRAVVYENDQMFTYRLRGDTVERVRVVPLMSDRLNVVPGGGVAAGDSVVTAGQAGLKDGTKVEIVEREAGAGATS